MSTIKNIFILHQQGMEPLVPYVENALNEVMDCFPQYKSYFPIKNLGNWQSDKALTTHNGRVILTPYESFDWYLERAKQRAIQEGRWQTRGQINASQMLEDLSHDPYFTKIPQWGIHLTTHDLYGAEASNFCLGVTRPDAFSIISTSRFMDRNHHLNLDNFLSAVQHEFGHIIRLTEGNHPNIRWALGPHCTHPECIMQQRMSGDFTDITKSRLRRKAMGLPPICHDCITQGRKNLFQLYAAHEKIFGPNNPTR